MAVTQQTDALLEKVLAATLAQRRLPEATYRLQFHAGFTFQDARRLVPYLDDLGVTDCYASPYLKARPGSQHGYDISDHRVLNPEIGSDEDYQAWVADLRAHGLGQILDVVPNHMGIIGNENVWWNDVLENGPSSPYAHYFDIDWHPVKPVLRDKLLLPVLGGPYGKVLEAGQFSISYEAGAFVAHYFDHRFPIAPETYQKVLRHQLEELEQALGADAPEFSELQSILTGLSHLPRRTETSPPRIAERQREKEVIKRRLASLVESCAPVREFLERNLARFNGHNGEPHSFDLLDDLLNAQAYRLAFWRVAADEINYRRFFDVNELAALNQEDCDVFKATHALILQLLREGQVNGLRVDHPDGLYNPKQYLQRLQQHFVLEQAHKLLADTPGFSAEQWHEQAGPLLEAIQARGKQAPASPLQQLPLYVVVEKILDKDEPLPQDWPVHGTTGYEFLNALNGIFVDANQAAAFSRIYHRYTGMDPLFREFVHEKKFLILQVSLSSELHMLANQLDRLSEKNRWSRDFTQNSLRHALREIIACFPVYRSYTDDDGVQPRDRHYIEAAVAQASQRNPAISTSLFDFVRDMLLLNYPNSATEADRAEQRRFVGKFQQVTGPVMAKGLEDTAFYVYNRLLSLNEVGGDPGQFGTPHEAFHLHNLERQKNWPYALSTTSTHDTKRSEDVRARLNVLSELPREWWKCLVRWRRFNKKYRTQLREALAPEANDEYLLYQTLLGAWPVEPCSDAEYTTFIQRVQQYMQKATHEAKVHTSWINPNPAYDEAVPRFIARILDRQKNRRFLDDFRAFQRRISHYGFFNSLSQTLLKIASPGLPDIYQGTELWDLSLVDPDNRRPVDYELRQRLLRELQDQVERAGPQLPALARQLTQSMEDGRIKLHVTRRALRCRRDHPGLFTAGEYLIAEADGSQEEHMFGFVRRHDRHWAAAVVPRLLTRVTPQAGDLPLGEDVWGDTVLLVPGIGTGQRCRNVFTNEVLTTTEWHGQGSLRLAEVFANFPVALLLGQP